MTPIDDALNCCTTLCLTVLSIQNLPFEVLWLIFSVNVANIGPLLVAVRFAYIPSAHSISTLIVKGGFSKSLGKVSYVSMKFSITDWNFIQKRRGRGKGRGRKKEGKGRGREERRERGKEREKEHIFFL